MKPGNFVDGSNVFVVKICKNGVTLIVLACTGFQSSIVLGCFLLLVLGSVRNHVNVYAEFTKDLAQLCFVDIICTCHTAGTVTTNLYVSGANSPCPH